MAKLSLGRRLLVAASKAVKPSRRWTLFRLPNGIKSIREFDFPIYPQTPGSPRTTLGNDKLDVVRDRVVFRIDNGFANHNGATLTPDGTLIREISREWRIIPDGHSKLKKPAYRPKVHHVEKAASIAIEHNSNYCHFFYDCLPRLPILREAGLGHLPLYAPLAEKFQGEILDLMGYPSENRIASYQHPILQAKELYVPTYDGNQGEFPDSVRKFLQTELLDRARARRQDSGRPRRLYISRKDSTSRRILNEEELFGRLKPMGFEFVVMAEMSVIDQILAFADATCIVTAHGASLTNLVFSRPECVLFEIFPPRIHAPCYQDLSGIMGMKAFAYRGKGVQIGEGDLAQDIIVEGDLIEQILREVKAFLKP